MATSVAGIRVSTARLLAMTSWTNSRSSHWDSSRPPEPVMAQVIWAVRQHGRSTLEQVASAGADVGVVALVLGIDNLVVVVEHGELNGGGTHVDAQVQVATSVLGVEDRAFGGVGGGDGYGLSGGGGLASDGRLPCRVLGLGNRLGDLLGSGSRGLLRGVHHGGRSLACGSDHTVFNALDEFAHCLSS